MKDDQEYNLPSQQKPEQTPSDDMFGNEPAIRLMREKLASVYPAPAASPPSQSPAETPAAPPLLNPLTEPLAGEIEKPDERSLEETKRRLLAAVRGQSKDTRGRWKPFLIALATGLTYLAVSYNEIAIAQVKQYLSPGSQLTTPVIVDPRVDVSVGQEPRLIIPKINVDIPVVYDVTSYDEGAIQRALERGVVHYGQTALPGETGNNVIVGHSSNNFFNGGRYKFAFVLLSKLEAGDTFILHYQGQRFIYKVTLKRIIEPNDFSLIQPTERPTTTLITCTPPGTNWQRLVVQAEQISPDPAGAKEVDSHVTEDLDEVDTVVPSNAPSFWQNIFNLFD